MVSLRSLFGAEASVLKDTDFQLLMLPTVFPVLGSTLLAPVLDSMLGPFGVSPAEVGLLLAVFSAPAILLIPVTGMLADRYGRKPVLVVSLFLFGLAGLGIAFTTDFRVALGLRFLQGIGFGGINPIIITSIGDLYTGARETTGQGIRFTVSGTSGAVFPLLAGFLVVSSWRYPFFLYGLALPVGILVALRFHEPSADEDGVGLSWTTYRRELASLIARRRVLAVLLARALPPVVWVGFATYNSLIVVRVLGGTPPQAGLLFALFNLATAVAGSQVGRVVDRRGAYRGTLVAGNVLLGIGFGAVSLAPTFRVALVGGLTAGLGLGTLMTLYRSVITGLGPLNLRAGLVSVAESGGRLSATVTPVAMGAAIAVTTPVVGAEQAIQLAGVGAAAIVGSGGIAFTLIGDIGPR